MKAKKNTLYNTNFTVNLTLWEITSAPLSDWKRKSSLTKDLISPMAGRGNPHEFFLLHSLCEHTCTLINVCEHFLSFEPKQYEWKAEQ